MKPIPKARKEALQQHGVAVAQSVFTPRRFLYGWAEYGVALPGVERFGSEEDLIIKAFNDEIKRLKGTWPLCEGVETMPRHRLLINGQWHNAICSLNGQRYRMLDGSVTSNMYVLEVT